MQPTKIEWTDFTANPIKFRDPQGRSVWACVKVSDGCKNCYSEAIAQRWNRGGPFSLPVMKTLTPFFDDDESRQILRSKKIIGKRIFIGDMTDIFGPWVPFELLDKLFAVMALRPDVTFQLLTKRPERMAEYLDHLQRAADDWAPKTAGGKFTPTQVLNLRHMAANVVEVGGIKHCFGKPFPDKETWPLPNVHLGTSCEDQKRADERIPHLLRCPAAVRFLSCEPLLGPLNLQRAEADGPTWWNYLTGVRLDDVDGGMQTEEINWVIVGGESGAGARPCNVSWIRSIVRQCKDAGAACFVKQLGANVRWDGTQGGYLDGLSNMWPKGVKSETALDRDVCPDAPFRVLLKDRKGGAMEEWPEDLRVREMPSKENV